MKTVRTWVAWRYECGYRARRYLSQWQLRGMLQTYRLGVRHPCECHNGNHRVQVISWVAA